MTPLDGARISFFLGGMVPVPAPSEFSRAVEDIEIVQGGTPTGRDAFRITLGAGRTGAGGLEYDLLSSGLLDLNQRVAAVGLVGTTLFGLLDGVILDHQFVPGDGPGGGKLVITGEDVTAFMDFEEENETYPNQADGLIAPKVVAKYARFKIVPPLPRPGPIETAINRVTTQTETDFAFLQRLARRNGNVFYAEPTPVPGVSRVTWGPEPPAGLPQAALTSNFYSGTTVRCLRFHLDALAPREVTLPESGATPGLGGLAGRLPTGLPLATSPVSASRKRMARDSSKLSTARAQSRLAAARAESPDALVAEGELNVVRYGEPLKARQLVGAQGLGPAHSGNYYVRQVVHRLRPRTGEYLQRFTMVREGRGAATPFVR